MTLAPGGSARAERRGLLLAFAALVTALGYVGFVAGPPLVGVLSALTTLPTALALLAVLTAAVALVAPLALRAPARS